MQADAKALGLNIYIASGYRPYVSQNKIYNNYIKRDGKKPPSKWFSYCTRCGL